MKKLLSILLLIAVCLLFVACDDNAQTSSSEQTSSSLVEDFYLTIKFHANGGTGTMESFEIAGGTSENIPLCAYVNEGYAFAGWATSEAGKVSFADGAGVLASADKSEVLELYAIWEQKKTTISFEGNGGSGLMEKLTVDELETIYLPSVKYTRYGYEFLGWATEMRGEVIYEDGASFTAEAGAKSVTLWAIWEVNGTKISFDANGGTGSMGTALVGALDASPLPECEFTREGYVFKGWSRTLGGALEFTDGGSFSASGGNHEITLYAVWERLEERTSIVIALDLSSTMGSLAQGGVTYFDLAQNAISSLMSSGEIEKGSTISVILFDADSILALPVTVIDQNEAEISAQICLAMEAYFYEHTDENAPSVSNRVSAQAGNIDANGYKIKSQGRSYGTAINRASSALSAQSTTDRRFIFISCGDASDKGSGYAGVVEKMAKAGIVTSTILLGDATPSAQEELEKMAEAGGGVAHKATSESDLTTTLINLTKGE